MKKFSNPRDSKMNSAKPVKAQAGSTAVLHCDTTKLGDIGKENTTAGPGVNQEEIKNKMALQIIWIKMYENSFQMLTNGNKTMTDDKRIFASNKIEAKDWSLTIRYTQFSDEGLYQCQMCTNAMYNKNGLFVKLRLIQAEAVIIGPAEKEVEKAGSPLRLSCMLKYSIEPPRYIFWYHEDRMINYDLNDGATVRYGRQGSELIFPRAQKKHAGNYSCVPSNAKQASVMVIIKSSEISTENGEGGGKKSHPQDHILNMLVLISTFHLYR